MISDASKKEVQEYTCICKYVSGVLTLSSLLLFVNLTIPKSCSSIVQQCTRSNYPKFQIMTNNNVGFITIHLVITVHKLPKEKYQTLTSSLTIVILDPTCDIQLGMCSMSNPGFNIGIHIHNYLFYLMRVTRFLSFIVFTI